MKQTIFIMLAAFSICITGCATAVAEPTPKLDAVDKPMPEYAQATVQVHKEPVEATAEEYYEEQSYDEYYEEPVYQGNSYGNSFYSDGVAYIGDTEFKWYSQNVMPGGGLDELNANGRHVDEETGFVVDGDGYIAVASPWGKDEIGTVVETPYGQGKVYDENMGDAYDLYTDF